MPRASDAYPTEDKWQGWILAPHGHGKDWARVSGVGPDDSKRIWAVIAAFDRVELLEPSGDVPAGARGGVLELRDDEVAMVEITTPELDPAPGVVFVSLTKLRRLTDTH